MQNTQLSILASEFVTPDTKRFVTEKPEGFVFSPGQALLLSIDLPEYEDIVRPYSITSVNAWNYLEFFIKSYPTGKFSEKVKSLNAGAKFNVHGEVNGIKFKGPGIFIAGGTGITAFISILRALYLSKNMRNVGLIYSVREPEDVILAKELQQILGENMKVIFTRHKVIGFRENRIDKDFLVDVIGSFDNNFYIAGKTGFVNDITRYLLELGAKSEHIII
ncbi:MAG: FAD-binding oxidoreductase [Flavobacteriaceae bacterium]|nr:FAD-binding oxidoreductase [Flavobacteriaceae bacterium]